jgi:hypothetical protein
MKKIPVDNGTYWTIVDDEDYEELSKYKWTQNGSKNHRYVKRSCFVNKKRIQIYMHRQIMNTPKGMQTDHINHDTMDNRRSNLRVCTKSQNNWNISQTHGKISKYKGVGYRKCNKYRPWQTTIHLNNKPIYLGAYATEVEAARAYNDKAKELFGEFAYLNPVLTS